MRRIPLSALESQGQAFKQQALQARGRERKREGGRFRYGDVGALQGGGGGARMGVVARRDAHTATGETQMRPPRWEALALDVVVTSSTS